MALAMTPKKPRGDAATPRKGRAETRKPVTDGSPAYGVSEMHPDTHEVSESHPDKGSGVTLTAERGDFDDRTGCHSDTQTVKDKQIKINSKETPLPPKAKNRKLATRSPKGHGFDPGTVELPDSFDRHLFQEFCDSRLERGKPMTARALKQFVTINERYPAPVLSEMFRRAVANDWQALYPLKPDELQALSNPTGLAVAGNPADARAAGEATSLLSAMRSRK